MALRMNPVMAFNDVRISGTRDKALIALDRYKSDRSVPYNRPARNNLHSLTGATPKDRAFKGEEDLRANGDS